MQHCCGSLDIQIWDDRGQWAGMSLKVWVCARSALIWSGVKDPQLLVSRWVEAMRDIKMSTYVGLSPKSQVDLLIAPLYVLSTFRNASFSALAHSHPATLLSCHCCTVELLYCRKIRFTAPCLARVEERRRGKAGGGRLYSMSEEREARKKREKRDKSRAERRIVTMRSR